MIVIKCDYCKKEISGYRLSTYVNEICRLEFHYACTLKYQALKSKEKCDIVYDHCMAKLKEKNNGL